MLVVIQPKMWLNKSDEKILHEFHMVQNRVGIKVILIHIWPNEVDEPRAY